MGQTALGRSANLVSRLDRLRVPASSACRARAASSTPAQSSERNDDDTVCVADDDVAKPDDRACERDRLPERRRPHLVALERVDPSGKNGEPELADLVRVAHRAVDHEASETALHGIGRHELAEVAAVEPPPTAHTRTEPGGAVINAWWRPRLSRGAH